MPTVATLIKNGSEELSCTSPSAKLDAEVFIAHIMQTDRLRLIADKANITPTSSEAEQFAKMITRRKAKEPVAYITGSKGFYKHSFFVNSSVLIPRPETELLLEQSLLLLPPESAEPVLELCTGSGCVAISLAMERPNLSIVATDLSADALTVAKQNQQTFKAKNITLKQSNLWEAVEAKYRLILANPPYVSKAEMDKLEPDVAKFEPHLALFAPCGGMLIIKRIVREAPSYLLNGGYLLLEIGYDQGKKVMELFELELWEEVECIKDFSGHNRVIKAKLKG